MIIRLFQLAYRPLVRRAAMSVLPGRPHHPGRPEAGRWTKRETDELLRQTWRGVPELLRVADLPHLPTVGNRHNVLLAAITTAAYRALVQGGTPRAHAAQLVADLGWTVYGWGLRAVSLPQRLLPGAAQGRLERTLNTLMVFPFSAPGAPGYEVETFADDQGFHTNWTHCPPQTFVRKVAEQLGDLGDLDAFYQSWCLYDWPGADVLVHDGATGHYERPRTLSRGDALCDMCWHAAPTTEGSSPCH
ncbi:hypothetical protein GW813_08760 [bacterium]|nr:hypothetical protein [bacterium]